MAKLVDINLLSSSTTKSVRYIMLEQILRKVAFVAVTLVIIFGLGESMAYLYFTGKLQSAISRKTELIDNVSQSVEKEIVYRMLLQYLEPIGVLTKRQVPLDEVIATVRQLAGDTAIRSIGFTADHRVSVRFAFLNLESGLDMVATLVNLVDEKVIEDPTLGSVSIAESEEYTVTVSFTHNFL